MGDIIRFDVGFGVVFRPKQGRTITENCVESSPFPMDGDECSLKLLKCRDRNNVEKVKMFLKGIRSSHLILYLDMSASNENENNTVYFPTEKIEDLNRCIWSTNFDDLQRALPNIKQWNLSFRCVFRTESEYNSDQRLPAYNLGGTLQCGLNGSCSQEELSAAFGRLLKKDWSLQDRKLELVKNIYKAADACGPRHKKECMNFLIENLKLENACEYLMFANDDEFKEKVIEYIIRNGVPLMPTYWDQFNAQYTREANEILLRMVRHQ